MYLSVSTAGGLLILSYMLLKAVSLARFYLYARRAGFPIYVSPIPSQSAPWLILGPALRPQFKQYLPEWVYERIDLVVHGWEFRKKAEMHRRLGKTFVIVTPDECSLWVADPALGNVILQRRKDFIQKPIVARLLGFFGSNVLQSNGDDWQRQRRIVAPNLNERISESVWTESCQQARVMADYMLQHPGGQTLGGLRCLAINVLGYAAYGQHHSWSPEFLQNMPDLQQGGRKAYFQTISLVAVRFLEAALLPKWFMKLPFMPSSLQLLARQMEKVPSYVREILDDERRLSLEESEARSNVLSMLVRFSDRDRQSNDSSNLYLAEDEISGNLWIFTAAGFETTANTMGYAVTLLAVYPEWQAWIREELRALDSDVSTWQYNEVFPKCQRTLALMFETLRHFTPVIHSTRYISQPQQLVDAEGLHQLTPPMDVLVSAQSIHFDPTIWGADVSDFRPSRWLDDDSGQLITPAKGTFIPWSGGPRVCPGMKMSQVEFVATMATLFRSAECKPLQIGSETATQLRGEFLKLMDASIAKLTLQLAEPKRVQLQWLPVS